MQPSYPVSRLGRLPLRRWLAGGRWLSGLFSWRRHAADAVTPPGAPPLLILIAVTAPIVVFLAAFRIPAHSAISSWQPTFDS
jgi:hypothetical protein